MVLGNALSAALRKDEILPFVRRIVAQDGSVKNDGSRNFTADELLRMDWLCDNVEGHIPEFSEIMSRAQALVREQGIYLDRIPKKKEGAL